MSDFRIFRAVTANLNTLLTTLRLLPNKTGAPSNSAAGNLLFHQDGYPLGLKYAASDDGTTVNWLNLPSEIRVNTLIASAIASTPTLAPAPLRRTIVRRAADAVVNDVRLVQFEIEATTTLNRVRGSVAVTQAGKLLEIAIYNAKFQKLTSTEQREIPEVGPFEFAHPEVILTPGTYYYSLTCNSTTAQFGVNPYAGGLTTPIASSGALTTPAAAPTTSTSTASGTLPGGGSGSYAYVFSYYNSTGETASSPTGTASLTATGSVTLSWPTQAGADGVKIYGRVSGTKYLLATVPIGTLSWTDNGSLTPDGSKVQPYTNTTLSSAGVPAPLTLSAALSVQAVVPALTAIGKDALGPSGFLYIDLSTIRVYGVNASGVAYGWNTATGRVCKSTDNGATFTDLMLMPSTGSGTINDVIEDSGKLYIFTSTCTLFVSSDLTSSATWTDISAPVDDTNMRHTNAVGRPYGGAIWNGYVFQGEYSGAPNELAGGPRILRYNISAGTWAISKQFSGARHIHSFFNSGSSKLWVSIGDAGYGADVGIHRLTPALLGTGTAPALDPWAKWTGLSTNGNTDHYPVDIVERVATVGLDNQIAPAGVYGTSDRPGKHLVFAKTTGTAGSFNLNAQVFRPPDGDSTETVRSLAFDVRGNAYWWTAETSKQRLMVSPPPYSQSYVLKDFPASPTLFLCRLSLSGEWFVMFTHRFHAVTFPGQ